MIKVLISPLKTDIWTRSARCTASLRSPARLWLDQMEPEDFWMRWNESKALCLGLELTRQIFLVAWAPTILVKCSRIAVIFNSSQVCWDRLNKAYLMNHHNSYRASQPFSRRLVSALDPAQASVMRLVWIPALPTRSWPIWVYLLFQVDFWHPYWSSIWMRMSGDTISTTQSSEPIKAVISQTQS